MTKQQITTQLEALREQSASNEVHTTPNFAMTVIMKTLILIAYILLKPKNENTN